MSLKDELDALGAHVQLPISRRKALMQAAALIEGLAVSVSGLTVPGATRSITARRMVIDGDLAVPAGNITIGPVASTRGNVIIDSAGIRLRTGTTNKINLTTLGDVFIGSDLSQPASQYISIFSVQQTYNSENFLAGDMLIGDNSASKSNIKWDKANGQLKFRGGTTTQAYVDTTGAITAGGGNVVIDTNGITLTAQSGYAEPSAVSWKSGSTVLAGSYATYSVGDSALTISIAPKVATDLAQLILTAAGNTTSFALQVVAPASDGNGYATLYPLSGTLAGMIIGASAFTTAPATMLDVRGSGTFTAGLNVGTATAAGTGVIKTSNAVTVGLTTDTSAAAITVNLRDAGTATTPDALIVNHLSSGTPAAGFGTEILIQAESSTNTLRNLATITGSWVVATDASRSARVVFSVGAAGTGLVECMRLEQANAGPVKIGFLGATAVAKQATITQTYSTTSTTLAADTASNMVAGGTGTAAGGWDTAAHRDTSITAFTNLRTDVDNCKNVLNSVVDALQAYGLLG